jgi:phosphoenolpyruvate phosphomutase
VLELLRSLVRHSSYNQLLLAMKNSFPFTGFKGIWGSGLSVSASMGVRDSNEASWTQVTDVLEFMSDATTIPILLDADTGFGNFNNARRLVSKLEQIGVAGQ